MLHPNHRNIATLYSLLDAKDVDTRMAVGEGIAFLLDVMRQSVEDREVRVLATIDFCFFFWFPLFPSYSRLLFCTYLCRKPSICTITIST